MSKLSEFIDRTLFPRVFEKADILFPEFQFALRGENWVSGNTHRLSGASGHKTGSVYLYHNTPFCIVDFSSGTQAITTYLQKRGDCESWWQAIHFLAKQVGLAVPDDDFSESEIRKFEDQERRAELLEVANTYFIDSLSNQDSPVAKSTEASRHIQYLISRGYNGKFFRRHFEEYDRASSLMEVGFIPSQHALKEHLNASFQEAEIDQFLFKPEVEGQKKSLHKNVGVTNKLTIPFRSPTGKILGFAFRDIDFRDQTKGNSKYLYSNFKLTSILFNLRPIQGDRDLIVVEGPMDAMYARALGIPNMVALGGTSFNPTRIHLAKKSGAKRVTLCLDQDEAGRSATRKAIDTIQKHEEDLEVYIANLPPGVKDPDEYLRSEGVEPFLQIIRDAPHCSEYLLARVLSQVDQEKLKQGSLTSKETDDLATEIISIGSQLDNPIRKEIFYASVQELCGDVLPISKENIEAASERVRQKEQAKKADEQACQFADRYAKLIQKGERDEAQELLRQHHKQSHDAHTTAQAELLKPVSKAEFIQLLKDKRESIPSDLHIGNGEPKDTMLELPSGAISIFVAPTSHGKTSIILNIARNIAANLEIPGSAFFFSYEESRSAILLKALNMHANQTLSKDNKKTIVSYFKTGNTMYVSNEGVGYLDAFKDLTDGFFTRLIENSRLQIIATESSSEELIESIHYLNKTTQVSAVFIDYIQFIRSRMLNQKMSRQEELKKICMDLNDCAKATGLPIILAAQFNRTVTDIAGLLSTNIGEAGDIERAANLVVGLWNRNFPEEGSKRDGFKKTNKLYAKILKDRDRGRIQEEVDFDFDGNTGRITNAPISNKKMILPKVGTPAIGAPKTSSQSTTVGIQVHNQDGQPSLSLYHD